MSTSDRLRAGRLADNISSHLEKKKITKKKLSDLTGIDITQICNYTIGYCAPNVKNLWKIARALETTMDELMEGVVEE